VHTCTVVLSADQGTETVQAHYGPRTTIAELEVELRVRFPGARLVLSSAMLALDGTRLVADAVAEEQMWLWAGGDGGSPYQEPEGSSADVVGEDQSSAASQASDVCAICQYTCSDSLAGGQLGRLDCCGHEYHFACIRKWVLEQSNTCPQCNKTVAKVSRCSVDRTLEEVVIGASVDHRQQGYVNGVQAYMAEQESVESCAGCGVYAHLHLPAFAVVTCAAVVPHAHCLHAHVSQALATVTRGMT
jgi:hypothetical protein